MQTQNYLRGQKYILLLYIGISKAMNGEHFMQYSSTGLLGIAEHATLESSVLGTKIAENLINLSAMRKLEEGWREKLPQY